MFPSLKSNLESVGVDTDAFLRLLYTHARNGLFHLSMTRAGIILHDAGDALGPLLDRTRHNLVGASISRPKLQSAIAEHFSNYIHRLRRNESDLSPNFRKGWEVLHWIDPKPPSGFR